MQLVWRPEAVRDLEGARAWIEQESPTKAATIAGRIRTAVERLAELPFLGRPGRVSGTRELIVPRAPYLVPYRVRDETVEILRVYHHARSRPDRLP